MRDQHRVLELEQTGVDLRLLLEHVEAGALDLALAERVDERLLIDDGTAGRVDEVRVLAHLLEAIRVDQVLRLVVERAVQRDDVGRLEQLVERHVLRTELGLDRGIRLAATRVDDLHAEGLGATRRRLADQAEADDAERLALDAGAEHVEHAPDPGGLGADHALALAEAAGRHQDQRHRDVGGGLRQHGRRVREPDSAAVLDRLRVDVVEAHGDVRDHLQLRTGRVEHGVVDLVVQEADDRVRALDGVEHLLAGERTIVRREPHVAVLGEEIERRLGDAARDDDAGTVAHACIVSSRPRIASIASWMFSRLLAYERRR